MVFRMSLTFELEEQNKLFLFMQLGVRVYSPVELRLLYHEMPTC